MSRTVKLIVLLAILEMIVLDMALIVFKGVSLGGHDPQHRYVFQLMFFPAWTAIGVLYAGRRLASRQPRISESHRRFLETGISAAAIVTAALHGFIAYTRVEGVAFDRLMFLRLLVVFVGGWTALRGNFAAKLDPPSGDGAPTAAVWTHNQMRFGWGMVLSGLAIIVCGLVGSPTLFLPVMLAAIVLGVAAEIGYRRMTRPQRHA